VRDTLPQSSKVVLSTRSSIMYVNGCGHRKGVNLGHQVTIGLL